ncbi:transketolase [Anaerosporomusa subterranea]|uniref:Transketolase n=1 Tax=Anaerosporomusa subterranea TaxID=1794912 RepID=A0A154BR48_ANASB|nr:transketolase C-terminal domain-containing protein [Anaerosporomusa subterranea]KYZ75998.1 transketolase [Anaerosporomusa subterranea]
MKAMREAYGEALVELGRSNPDVVVLDADVASSTRSILFKNAFPERFFNIGIAEGNMVGIAAGLAATGKIAFVNTFALFFALRAADPIRSLVAYNQLNVKIAGAYGGFSDSYDGASHQSVEDVSIMRSIPNLTVVVPSDEHSTRKATLAAAALKGPVYLRLSRAEVPPVHSPGMNFEIGKGIVVRTGKDVTIVANGYMVTKALEAATLLAETGIEAEVIDMHTVKPLDEQLLLASASKTGAVVTVEENTIYGGLGSAVAEVLAKTSPVPLEIVGIKDVFGESGSYEGILSKHGLDKDAVAEAVQKVLNRKLK